MPKEPVHAKNSYFLRWILFTVLGFIVAGIGGYGLYEETRKTEMPFSWLVMNCGKGIWGALAFVGAAALILAVFCLIFRKKVQKHCRGRISGISAAISAMGSAGLYCILIWFSIVAFGEMQNYPVAYPASILGGTICFFLCIALLFWYVRERQKRFSLVGVLLDILLCVLLFVPMFLVWNFLSNLVQPLF